MPRPRPAPVHYEARPTRMFGAYTLWVTYADGSQAQLDHGTPQRCLAEAVRLNDTLAAQAAASRPAE
jgi:hypothetical protein